MRRAAPEDRFKADARAYVRRDETRAFLRGALAGYEAVRARSERRFADWQAARTRAAAIKEEAIANLDRLLPQFIDRLERRGARVFVASDGQRALDYIIDVIRRREARSIVKSKSMTGEEIGLAAALERDGFEVVESDLGEFIVQLRHEPPFHIVFPSMHLKRGEIRDLFREKLGRDRSENPEDLTMIAREVLRQKYLDADVGISGVNFAPADAGAIVMCTNEGNGRLTTSLPKVHIAIMGIEKIIPRMADLALLLPMLATAGTGQPLTCYTSVLSGPRHGSEPDGPDEMHVVILDNGRTSLLASPEQRDTLRCIRCGACLNVCPIFRNVGGHTYGTTYQGPIGSVITPRMRGLAEWSHLSEASSLCGACTETCPVRIDLHHHLLENRRDAVSAAGGAVARACFRIFAWLCQSRARWNAAAAVARIVERALRPVRGTRLDPLRAWTTSRDLPRPAPKSFAELWSERTRRRRGESRNHNPSP